jgi:hypothetical protein
LDVQGRDEDGEGGGSDIGALLGNLGPLIGGLSGVSPYKYCLWFNDGSVRYAMYIVKYFFQLTNLDVQGGGEEGGGGSDIGALLGALGPLSGSLSGVSSPKYFWGKMTKVYAICYVETNQILLSTNQFGRTGWR